MILTYFACTREVIQKSLNQNSCKIWDFVQAFGPQFSMFNYLEFGSQHLKRKNKPKGFPFFQQKMYLSICNLVRQINGIFLWNLEIRFKLFFLMDSCSPDLAFQESD